MREKTKLNALVLALYSVAFYVMWSVRELIIRPQILDSLGEMSFQMAETAIKLFLWTLPAVLLIRHYRDDMFISGRQMLTAKTRWLLWMLLVAVFFLLNSLRAWLVFGKIAVHPGFRPVSLVETVLFVGVTEEVVFRAWLLNATLKMMKLWRAVLLNAAMFALIHFPIWIYHGDGVAAILSNSLFTLAFSAAVSWVFIKSKNIIATMVIHMAWNLSIVLFFG